MPELPEVETVRSGLAPVLEGKRIKRLIVRRQNLRFDFPDKFAERLAGVTILKLSRRAKYLLFELDSGETLLSHLGMSGSFLALSANEAMPKDRKTKHDHVVFEMLDGASVIYNDPRRFGFMDLFATDEIDKCKFLQHLGPEPVGNQLSASDLKLALSKRKAPIKTALLDQKTIAGLGNIYVCEALFRANIHPASRSCDLSLEKLEVLVSHIRQVIRQAIEAGGSSLNDFTNADGDLGYFQHSFDVYDRANETCKNSNCAAKIERIVQGGRSSFYCPNCQK